MAKSRHTAQKQERKQDRPLATRQHEAREKAAGIFERAAARQRGEEPVAMAGGERALVVPRVGVFHTMGQAFTRFHLKHESGVRVTVDVPSAVSEGIEAVRVYAVRPVKGGGL